MTAIQVKPVITEKTSHHVSEGKFSFFVPIKSNKVQIKQYFLVKYKLNVDRVNVIIRRGKLRRRGKIVGATSSRKIAIITFKKDQKLEEIEKLF